MIDTDRLDLARTLPLGGADASSDQTETTPLNDAAARPDTSSRSAEPRDGAALAGGSGASGGDGRASFYRGAWRHIPRDLGYMGLTTVLLGTLYLAFPSVVFEGSLRGIANPFSALLFFVALLIARWLGVFERLRIGWAEPRPIRPVDWTPRWQKNWWTRTASAVANPHYWLYLLHAVVVYPLAAFVTVGAGVTLLIGFFGPIVAAVYAFANGWQVNDALMRGGVGQTWPWVVGVLACVVSMAASVLLFPLWTRGSVLGHYWIDYALLGGFRAEVLERRVEGLQASRAGAVTAEGQALRQIERDLHDGPQQRLVRLQMDLSAAERMLEHEPDKAGRLISEASAHAKDALDEIRALSRGFAPPILLDRGLTAALEALVARMPIPVGLDVRLPDGLELPTEIQRNVYFTVSELLTNTTKHAGATAAGVYLGLTSDSANIWYLTGGVTDDGRGGARPRAGHGIEGLMGRMRALDGELTVASPDGGPTEATLRIPLGALNGVPTDVRGPRTGM